MIRTFGYFLISESSRTRCSSGGRLRAGNRSQVSLHVMGPGFDARYVTLVLRIGRGHVGMAHLGGRVRIVRVVGGRYVLHGGEGRLELVISDYLRLGSIFPGSIDNWLIRAVSLVRSLHFLVVSAKSVAFHPAKCSGADRN